MRAGYPYQKEGGLADLWFFSSSENIDKFTTLYDHMDEYTKPGRCPTSPKVGVSNHYLATYHLKRTDLINKLRFVFKHLSKDQVDPLVRVKYFNSKI